jgi:hypothetical protein
VDVTNTSSANIDYQLTVVVVSVGVLTISHQNVVRSVGVLTTDDILASKQQDALPWSPSGDIYGGGIWDDVKGFFKKAMGFLKPLAAKAAMAAPIVAPEFAPYATGASSILNAIGDMTGTGMTGGGLVGGALVGGKKISRKQLQKMLK